MSLQEDLPIPATGAVAPSPGQRPKHTLLDLVTQLTKADEMLADPTFNPDDLIGALRGKVDAVHAVVERMEGVANHLKALAKPLTEKASALLNNRQKLREYVTHCLLVEKATRAEFGESDDHVSLPGEAFKVRLRQSPPALQIDREATAEDFVNFSSIGLVNQIRRYEWDRDAIKMAIENGSLPFDIPAKLTVGHYPQWTANIPQQLEPKKKKAKKQ